MERGSFKYKNKNKFCVREAVKFIQLYIEVLKAIVFNIALLGMATLFIFLIYKIRKTIDVSVCVRVCVSERERERDQNMVFILLRYQHHDK